MTSEIINSSKAVGPEKLMELIKNYSKNVNYSSIY